MSGLNPVWISLAAAIGEELLFRAALQPLLGVWITSLIFLLTHTPVYQFRKLNQATLVQAAGVFGASVVLGFIYQYVGLVAAVMVHTALDVVGLYLVRNVLCARTRGSHAHRYLLSSASPAPAPRSSPGTSGCS